MRSHIKVWSSFSKLAWSRSGAPCRASQSAKHLILPKAQEGRKNYPADDFSVGNPRRGFSSAKHLQERNIQIAYVTRKLYDKQKKCRHIKAPMLRIGEPPTRVPHGTIIHRIIFPPLLRFLKHKYFALCEAQQGALLLDHASFEKLDQTFIWLRGYYFGNASNKNFPFLHCLSSAFVLT